MERKRCQVCDGPVVNGRCKLCGMPYRNDETLYHLNERWRSPPPGRPPPPAGPQQGACYDAPGGNPAGG